MAYTIGFNTLVWMNTGAFRLIKIYSEVQRLSFHLEQALCRHGRDIGMMVRQTDRQMALQLSKTVALPSEGSNLWCWFRSQFHYQLSQTLCSLMAVLAYTTAVCALVWMNTGMFRLMKMYSKVPEDSAFILSKSCFNQW